VKEHLKRETPGRSGNRIHAERPGVSRCLRQARAVTLACFTGSAAIFFAATNPNVTYGPHVVPPDQYAWPM
jgi:hypothetical protein